MTKFELNKNPKVNEHGRVNLVNAYRVFKCEPQELKHHNSLWCEPQDANLETAINWINRHNSLVNSFVCNSIESIEQARNYKFGERETCINIFTPLNLNLT